MPRLHAVLVLLLTLLLQACGKEQTATDFGLEVRKPDGWTYVSAGQSAVEGELVRYSGADLRKAIAARTTAPLFALLKRAPPQTSLNPTFGINLDRGSETRGQTALALLEVRVKRATDNGPFQLAEAATATQLAGLPAARAELRAPVQGSAPQTRVRLNLVVIDDVSILLAATDALAGDNDASAEFAQILASLRFPGAPSAP